MGEFCCGCEEIEEELKKGVEGGDDEGENGDEVEVDDVDVIEMEVESRQYVFFLGNWIFCVVFYGCECLLFVVVYEVGNDVRLWF